LGTKRMSKHISRVTIGLPVYNGAKYLEAALDSILAQTFTDFELIISDNASTDNTEEICKKYSAMDERIRYHRNDKNLGAAPNFNQVFFLSSSEYFKWSAYDDILEPEYLSKCIEVLDHKPEVVLCFTQVKLIDENGKFLGEQRYNSNTSEDKPQDRFRNIALNTGNSAMPVFGLMRSKVAEKTGLIGAYPSSDVVFLAELSLYGPFYEIPDKLFYWRVHPEQSTKGEYAYERDRVAWFKTAAKDKISLPKWQYLFGFLRAIQHAPLSSSAQVYCYTQMIRWIMFPPHFRAMGKDLLLAIISLLNVRNR